MADKHIPSSDNPTKNARGKEVPFGLSYRESIYASLFTIMVDPAHTKGCRNVYESGYRPPEP